MLLLLALFYFAIGGAASAQTLSNSPDASHVPNLTVIQKKWSVEVHNTALDDDPFRGSDEHRQAERDRINNSRQNEIRVRQGKSPVAPPVRARLPETESSEISATYIYEVKVRNTGEKAIRTIAWEFAFFDPVSKQEVGRQRFVSKEKISPGKTKTLAMRSASPPTGTIDATDATDVTKAGKKLRDQYIEQVVIQSIEYADGSLWRAASN